MNKVDYLLNESLAAAPARDDDKFIDLERLLAVAIRQARVVAICAGIGVMLGIIYLQTTPPMYTASARILLDEGLNKIVDEVSATPINMQTDAAILSQIEILKSTRLALVVVDKERLTANEQFMSPPPSLAGRIVGTIRSLLAVFRPSDPVGEGGQPSQPATDGKRDYAAQLLQRNLWVERAGRSYVINLSYRSNDPELARRITQAYADAYLSDQLDANFDATERTTLWLKGRLDELETNSKAAALAAERFRAENGLTATRGELISEQQLSDLNGQLIIAQADTARALAKYQQYQAITESGPEEAVENAAISSDQPGDSVIGKLKTRYLQVTKREREITANFGADHQQAVALRREQQDISRQMFRELEQLASSFRNDYEVARSREMSLRENVDQLTGKTSSASQSMVQLRELEQKAAALSTLYQNFLARYQEAAQQQSFPITKVRVISEPGFPRSPSSPRTSIVLALSMVLGIMMGGVFGALNEFRERFFRLGDDVRSELGIKFLGYLPVLGGGRRGKEAEEQDDDETVEDDGQGRIFTGRRRAVIDSPASAFAETLRSAKIAGDVVLQGAGCKVIAVVSVLPGEGKSTVAANFAGLLAANGSRTLLVDGDLRNPSLSRGLPSLPQYGLVDAILGRYTWQSLLKIDPDTKLAMMPAVVHSQFAHTSELLASKGMKAFIQSAQRIFDYIVVDLPPLGPVVDAKAFEPLADGFIVVAEWGATPRALVRTTLQAEPQIGAKTLGLILNKADYRKLSKYGSFGSSERFLDRYSSYYLDQPKPTKAAFKKLLQGAAVVLRKLGSMGLSAFRKRAERHGSDLHASD
ncbi:chain-length determining protein [Mesorhizobium sp. L-8-10]|uniref:polysaccharide biosynthesis tyrosine autokinase n=1 Tax=unclassified Mesorhizobium TaxID=325217 RepID=UPI0019267BD1|nr:MULTISPECIES: polysaccharide biosynthesis tyrosine autokinase [unclassified Mesorhizobium]BCH23919.1 chain-length determining protein [Mesorhizobium sp. L-8-3]BCH31653.1 chain-length determining protein [Mesorhizobium sp. L-8-10]